MFTLCRRHSPSYWARVAHPRAGGRTDEPGKVVGTDAVRYNWINLDRTTWPPKWNRKSRYRTWRRAQACAAKQAALISCYCSIVISNKTALLLNMVRYRNYMPRRLLQFHSDRERERTRGSGWGSVERAVIIEGRAVSFGLPSIALIRETQKSTSKSNDLKCTELFWFVYNSFNTN